MKPTAKIFRNCPYEHEKDMFCEECPNYRACLLQREERKAEFLKQNLNRTEKKLSKVKKYAFTITVLCILLIIALIISISSNVWKTNGDGEDVREIKAGAKAVLSEYGPSENYYYNISYEDKVTMAKVIWVESGFECFEGKVAIAAVILNRYYSDVPYFDKESITSVVTQPYQFASIEGVTMETLENHPSCMEAVEAACKGWDPTRSSFSEGALYFYAPDLMPNDFQNGIEVLKIGNVNFHYDYAS